MAHKINLDSRVYVVTESMQGGYLPNQGGYFSTKSAARDFMKSLADEHEDNGASVTTVRYPITDAIAGYLADYDEGADYIIELNDMPVSAVIHLVDRGIRSKAELIDRLNQAW